jgi:hypothetical protein
VPPGALYVVQRAQFGQGEQFVGGIGRGRLELGLRSGQCPRRAPDRIRCQLRCPFEKRGSRGDAPSVSGTVRRPFQVVGYRLVQTRGRLGPMPRSTIGIGLWICHFGQCVMYPPLIRRWGRPVSSGAHQGMTETHPRSELDQSQSLGWERGIGGDSELLGCAPQQDGVPHRFGRSGQQQPLRLGRKRPKLPAEALFDAVCERQRVGKTEPAGKLRRRQSARQLHQREWVPPRLGDDPVSHALIQPARDHRLQQRAGVSVIQSREDELWKSRQLPDFDGFTQREDHGDRFRQEAARDERQCLRRGLVEPLRIIDQADERPFLGHHGEQPEHREADGEAIRCDPGTQPERHA